MLTRYFDRGPMLGAHDHRLTVRGIKLFADGALGSRGAALLEPYTDEPGSRGLVVCDKDRMTRVARLALTHGFQVAVHAIGDRANRNVLDAYETAFEDHPEVMDPRFRIEHAQILDRDDIPRFAALGVIPSMQPTHCTSDMPWADTRLGAERTLEGGYVWRKLMDQGSWIPAGSDAPVENVDPLPGFYAAITRQDGKGWPEGGWHADQRMTREETLRAFTLNGAKASFEEGIKGSLETGKLADFVVLSADIMEIPPAEILKTRVDLTVVGGEVVFRRDS